ncbi:hypothetical protein NM208_g3041 [Fusarium decemcellulare]|uniref:Uncharacterized protein n=1 Tax=Fusarium decemcellulare TaxID=57161 RepID=A0ACC1SQC6_9HYPO|nr:hypothetical protein NM208_g3041 [Fusarium decemcellulare]
MSTLTTIKLATRSDWIRWFRALKIKSKNEDLWNYIDPTNSNKPALTVTPPSPPDIMAIHRQTVAATEARGTEAASSSTQETPTAEGSRAIDDPIRERRRGLRYTDARNPKISQRRNSAPSDLKRRIAAIQNWILETVDDAIARIHLSEDETLVEWVKFLHDEFSLPQHERLKEAIRNYRDILEKPQQRRVATYKGTRDWFTQWRVAIKEARDVDLQEAKEADYWFTDLTEALRSTPLESWIDVYRVTKISNVRANTLSIGVVAADIRQALARYEDVTKTDIDHGEFVATEEAEEEAGTSPRQRNSRQGNPRKRSRQDAGEGKSRRCEACGLLHPLARCFYVFPEKRPRSFKAHKELEERVRQRLDDNDDNLTNRREIAKLCGTKNVIVSARPGSGKTATAEAIVAACPDKQVAMLTCSKRLQLSTIGPLRKEGALQNVVNILSKQYGVPIAVSMEDEVPLDDRVIEGKMCVFTIHQFKGIGLSVLLM